MVAHWHTAIDRLLQDDLLDVLYREAALDERGAHVHAEFLPASDRHHGADHQDAPRARIEMRPRPYLRPGAAGDEILPLGIEVGAACGGTVDPGVAEDLAASIVAASVPLLVIHRAAPLVGWFGRSETHRRLETTSDDGFRAAAQPILRCLGYPRRKPSTAAVYASRCSIFDICAASSTVSLAPGIWFLMYSFASSGVAGSCRPAIT